MNYKLMFCKRSFNLPLFITFLEHILKLCPYFDELEQIFAHKANINVPVVMDTLYDGVNFVETLTEDPEGRTINGDWTEEHLEDEFLDLTGTQQANLSEIQAQVEEDPVAPILSHGSKRRFTPDEGSAEAAGAGSRKTSRRVQRETENSGFPQPNQKRHRLGGADAISVLLEVQEMRVEAERKSNDAKLSFRMEKFQWKKDQKQKQLELAEQKLRLAHEENVARIQSEERIRMHEINTRANQI